jgi:hypothetical protein
MSGLGATRGPASQEDRDAIIEECAMIVTGFIQYGGSTKHGITINPYADVSAILRAIRKLKGGTPAPRVAAKSEEPQ